MNISLPIDFERLVEFRALVRGFGGGADGLAEALSVFARLYVELAYLAQSGRPLGQLSDVDFQNVGQPIGVEDVRAFRDALVESGLVVKDSTAAATWHCPRFARDNEHLRAGAMENHERAWMTSKLVRAQRKAQSQSLQLALLIPPEYFKKPDGEPMPSEECNRLLVLIRSVDSVLQSPERPHHMYTEGLVQDAYSVVSKHNEEAIRATLMRLVAQRKHPRLLTTSTEKLLADWDGITGQIK